MNFEIIYRLNWLYESQITAECWLSRGRSSSLRLLAKWQGILVSGQSKFEETWLLWWSCIHSKVFVSNVSYPWMHKRHYLMLNVWWVYSWSKKRRACTDSGIPFWRWGHFFDYTVLSHFPEDDACESSKCTAMSMERNIFNLSHKLKFQRHANISMAIMAGYSEKEVTILFRCMRRCSNVVKELANRVTAWRTSILALAFFGRNTIKAEEMQ